jgi:hypothetical protein
MWCSFITTVPISPLSHVLFSSRLQTSADTEGGVAGELAGAPRQAAHVQVPRRAQRPPEPAQVVQLAAASFAHGEEHQQVITRRVLATRFTRPAGQASSSSSRRLQLCSSSLSFLALLMRLAKTNNKRR